MRDQWWSLLKVDEDTAGMISEAEQQVVEQHRSIAVHTLYNQAKVLAAFQAENISEDCFHSNEGYGYHDHGRNKLEDLFCRIFQGEEAIVRPHFVSGTHTLYACLKGLLKPGERVVSVTGKPYDTLARAVWGEGQGSGGPSSLRAWDIEFAAMDTPEFYSMEPDALHAILENPTRAVFIQRSRGYDAARRSLTIVELQEIIQQVRSCNPRVSILVDNCYGEFVETKEPLEVGADLIAGSLIKNPGGGLAPTGGYIVGKSELVQQAGEAMTAPGLGKELGAFVSGKRLYFQGLFMAPHLVGEALKGAVTLAAALQQVGYRVDPGPADPRGDLIQAVFLKNETELQRLCRAVQHFSPVNSHLTPEAGKTAGYADSIYMAAGTFVQGASGEFTADAPVRQPYVLYLQGGLSYEHVILGLASLLRTILGK